ncbi:hemolysin XhlA, partial [Klebsiella pneumoniae]|uniref:hemolysin XhlA n=2 Tax=Enterobacteriaceae TaxID=543 RepID=UPI001D0DB075
RPEDEERIPQPHNNDDGGGGGDDMLQRVKELENKVATLVTDVAIIKDKLASKEDIQSVKTELHKELNAQTWKIITAIVITVLLAVFSKYLIK